MRKPKIILLFILTLVASLLIYKAYSEENYSIEVNNSIIKHVPDEYSFVGINWSNASKSYKEIFSDPQLLQEFMQALKDMNIDIIRYPGGQNVLKTFWDVPDVDILEALKKLPQAERGWINPNITASKNNDFIYFLKFCKNAGIKADIQVNVHNYFDKDNKEIKQAKVYSRYPNSERIWNTGKVDWNMVEKMADDAASQVKWVKDNGYSDTVKYWELGNEDYHKLQLNCSYTGDEYAKVASIFIKKMLAVDPSIKFIVTHSDYITEWNNAFLQEPELKKYSNHIIATTNHIYSPSKLQNQLPFEMYKSIILDNPKLDVEAMITETKTLLNSNGYNNTKIFMNEFNSGYHTNPYIHTWISAMGDARMIMSCANTPGCYHADFHELLMNWCDNDLYQNKGFGIIHFAKNFSIPFILMPEANVISLLNSNLKGNVLKTTFNKKTVYVSSVLNDNTLKVIILNKNNDQIINLKLNGFKNYVYSENKSLGIGVHDSFTVVTTGDSCSDPSEVKLLNILDNAIKVSHSGEKYLAHLPKNTLTVLTFKKSK